MKATDTSLDTTDIKQRFFGAGPTDIFQLLSNIDGTIGNINAASASSTSACLTQQAVSYTLAPFGQSEQFFAQCWQSTGAAQNQFVQFGTQGGVNYIYSSGGIGDYALRVTSLGGASDAGSAKRFDSDGGSPTNLDGGNVPNGDAGPFENGDGGAPNGGDGGAPSVGPYIVEAWIAIGANNASSGMTCGHISAWDDCSYGVIHLFANSQTSMFEMAVAGVGFGYCGAQFDSDGTTVYGIGSPDMGTTCNGPYTACVAASDISTPATCGASLTTFSIPALGRASTSGPNTTDGASLYPSDGGGSILLNGTPSDSMNFGPTTPTPGVGSL